MRCPHPACRQPFDPDGKCPADEDVEVRCETCGRWVILSARSHITFSIARPSRAHLAKLRPPHGTRGS